MTEREHSSNNTGNCQPYEKPEKWQRCPEGQFAALSSKLRGKRTRREFFQIGGSIAALVVGGVGLYLAGRETGRFFTPGGIFCSQVPDLLAKFKNSTISTHEKWQLIEHVANCSKCNVYSNELKDNPQEPCCKPNSDQA
ncbi:MAG: hypothetical protein ACFCD0_05325 [Gemmataceae bacterium]